MPQAPWWWKVQSSRALVHHSQCTSPLGYSWVFHYPCLPVPFRPSKHDPGTLCTHFLLLKQATFLGHSQEMDPSSLFLRIHNPSSYSPDCKLPLDQKKNLSCLYLFPLEARCPLSLQYEFGNLEKIKLGTKASFRSGSPEPATLNGEKRQCININWHLRIPPATIITKISE